MGLTSPAEGLRSGRAPSTPLVQVDPPTESWAYRVPPLARGPPASSTRPGRARPRLLRSAREFGDGRPRGRAEGEALAWAFIGYSVVAQDRSWVDAADKAMEIIRRIGPLSGVVGDATCRPFASLPWRDGGCPGEESRSPSRWAGKANDAWGTSSCVDAPEHGDGWGRNLEPPADCSLRVSISYRVSPDNTGLARTLLALAGIDRIRGELGVAVAISARP